MRSFWAVLWCLAAWGCTGGGGGSGEGDVDLGVVDSGGGGEGGGGSGGDGGTGPADVGTRPGDVGPADFGPGPVDVGPADVGPGPGDVGPADVGPGPGDVGPADGGSADGGPGGDGGGPECSAALPCDEGFECEGGNCVPVEAPEGSCVAGDLTPPCNGCPAGTVVPSGFVCVPAGTFTQGEEEWTILTRQVTLTRHFFIQTTEVTQGEWRALMGNNPARFQECGDTCPVERVSWLDALAFANAKSAAEGLAPCYDAQGAPVGGATPYACAGYRLPTEAEWEYAYRAGTQTAFYWGAAEAEAGDYAWFSGNSNISTHPVGTKLPNAWGLYDMAGNVFEWVHDWLVDYPAGAATDPRGPQAAELRVYRGGGWYYSAGDLRAALRDGYQPGRRDASLGFRLARSRVP